MVRSWIRSCAAFAAAVGLLAIAPAAAADAAGEAALLSRFEPVLRLAPGEPFGPIKVGPFLADSTLEQRAADGSWVVVGRPARDGSDLPAVNPPGCVPLGIVPCFRLNQQPCPAAGGPASLPCYVASLGQHAARPAMYARVLRTADRTVLEYWRFSYDNLLVLPFGADPLWQSHEGDWEVVVVVLDAAGEPVEAAYSQHCAGQRRPWASVPRATGDRPLVYVALGSHAGYFTAGFHPIPPVCFGPQVAQFLAQLGVTPVDVTGDGALVDDATVRRIRPNQPAWVRFPGTWGEAQYLHAPPPIGTVELGYSPRGPAYQAIWSDPLGVIASWPLG